MSDDPTTQDPQAEQSAARQLTDATDAATVASNPDVARFLETSATLLGPESEAILDLNWRQHFTPEEIGETLGIPAARVSEQLPKLPQLFGNLVRARILWSAGQPSHDVLARELTAADPGPFGPEAARLIIGHARTCESCRQIANLRVDPLLAYAATPVISPQPKPVPAPPAPPRPGPGPARAGGGPPPGIGPVHAPVSRLSDEAEAKKKKRILIGAIVAAVLLVAGVAFVLTRGGDSPDVATEGNTLSPSTVRSEKLKPNPTLPSSTTTTRPPTATTLATTTTTIADSFTAAMTVNGSPDNLSITQAFPTSAVQLSWKATFTDLPEGDMGIVVKPRHVIVRGPGITSGLQPVEGGMAVCPSAEPDTCNVVAGSYEYTIEYFVDEVSTDTKTFTLTVTPR